MSDHDEKLDLAREAMFQHFARIGQAVSSPQRLVVLNVLCQGEKTVETLAAFTGQSIANISAHLKVLRSACLVCTRREGKHIYYRLASESVGQFWLALRDLGRQQIPEVREIVRDFFEDPESLMQVDAKELARLLQGGEITLLDIRPADEFAAGHLPGARSVPFEEFQKHLGKLPRRGQLVAYCRGPYCVTALRAVQALRRRGFDARRLGWSVTEWKAAGRPLDVGM